MKEMHNIRLDVQLREQIKTRAATCGNAWTKQLQLDLSALYDVENPIESEPAQLTLLRKHAKSCGITIQDLLERCVAVIQIQTQPQMKAVNMTQEEFDRATSVHAPVDTTLPPPVPAPWMGEGNPAQGGSLEKFKATPLKFDASTGTMG